MAVNTLFNLQVSEEFRMAPEQMWREGNQEEAEQEPENKKDAENRLKQSIEFLKSL